MPTPNLRTAVDTALDRFLVASAMICEGDRPAAAEELRAAIRSLDGHHGAADLRADLGQLLAVTARAAS